MRQVNPGLVLTLLLAMGCLPGNAQSTADQKSQSLQTLINSKKYGFIAQSATAKKGRTVQLTPGYGLILNSDSLHVDLPYYGRAYTTSYPSSRDDAGIKFNSHDFSYLSDTTKKGGWEITIKPKGAKVSTIYLSISSSGYCSVRISSSDRDPISYYGTIADYTGH
jgi:Domain of unknown function (DUF4251)